MATKQEQGGQELKDGVGCNQTFKVLGGICLEQQMLQGPYSHNASGMGKREADLQRYPWQHHTVQ